MGRVIGSFLDPRAYLPVTGESAYAIAWYQWYVNPSGAGALAQPEEPPAEVQKQMELYDQILASGDQAKQNELMHEILDIARDQFYIIGISSEPPGHRPPPSRSSTGLAVSS